MSGSSAQLHESADRLSEATIDRHRAIVSLMEELEAVDWYDQRVEATDDASLAAVLAHNRDEEKEHAVMNLEWLRRNDPTWDEMLRTYLFTDRPLLEVEAEAEGGGVEVSAAPGGIGLGLGVGSLMGRGTL